MGPRLVVGDELIQEQRGDDRAGAARADVLQVRDRRVEVAAVGAPQRERPDRLARGIAGGAHLLDPTVVVAEHRRHLVAESDDLCPGECREVEDRRGLLATGGDERVGEDQATFCISVEDLDGRAVLVPDDVTDPLRVAAEHVVGDRKEGAHADLHAHVARRRQRPDDRGGTTHVALHGDHSVGRLDRQASGVERDALADQRDLLGGLGRLVSQAQQPRLARGAAADAEDAAEALALEGLVLARVLGLGATRAAAAAPAALATAAAALAAAAGLAPGRSHCSLLSPKTARK